MNRRSFIRIAHDQAGVAVLDFLCRRFTYHERAQWEDLIGLGQVLLNGRSCVPRTILDRDDVLEYVPSDGEEPPVSTDYTIVFEDQALLVIDKPGNLPCHPGGRYFRNTLWHLLKTERKAAPFFFVNRIDRETSGIVLVAKSAPAARNCQEQFQSGRVRKDYAVIVEGVFPAGPVCTEGFLLPDETSPVRKKQRFFPANSDFGLKIPGEKQRCLTCFHRIDRHRGKSLVSAQPVTGRMHQIRATLFSLGYPVTGDKIYGVDDGLFLKFIENRLTEEDRTRLCLSRQALHAESLFLRHPEDGRPCRFSAEMPKEMLELFQQ